MKNSNSRTQSSEAYCHDRAGGISFTHMGSPRRSRTASSSNPTTLARPAGTSSLPRGGGTGLTGGSGTAASCCTVSVGSTTSEGSTAPRSIMVQAPSRNAATTVPNHRFPCFMRARCPKSVSRLSETRSLMSYRIWRFGPSADFFAKSFDNTQSIQKNPSLAKKQFRRQGLRVNNALCVRFSQGPPEAADACDRTVSTMHYVVHNVLRFKQELTGSQDVTTLTQQNMGPS